MPKRFGYKGRGGGSGNWAPRDNNFNARNTFYDEHDDRGSGGGGNDKKRNSNGSDIKRRVSFKPQGSGGGRHGGIHNRKLADIAIRAHFLDDDNMNGEDRNDNYPGRGNFRGRGNRQMRRNSPPPRGQNGKQKILPGSSGWFLVVIPHGYKYEKEFIIKSLCDAISPEIFIPHYYKVSPINVQFYVDDYKMAMALQNADRKITCPDGFRMQVRVKSSIPQVQVDTNLRDKMKLAMVKRYNPQTRALDLTKFHGDPDLQDIFCALFRPTIMLAAIDVIAENIPDLEALNLDDNKIHLLDHFKCLITKLPNLKVLHMANNRISTAIALDALKGLPIVDLVLEGNPVKERIKDEAAYVSEVRKRLPKVIKLDGVVLPPSIGFDITESFSLPSPKASFLCDSSGAEIVRQFLEQYFIIYDSDNRQPLLDAYHEHAQFSLTATYNNANKLAAYLSFNRNCLRIRDADSRNRHLKLGRLSVVSFITELPATQHDPQSFCVDLSLFSSQLILLTVTGVFKERSMNEKNTLLRSFQRSLVIVPSGSGFCIRNEILHINNTTGVQERRAFKVLVQPEPTLQTAPQPQIQQAPVIQQQQALPSTSASAALDEATKMRMVQAMSQESNMNVEWSTKCLEETNWDFQRAGFIFTELHKQNKIPPEAFVKF